MTSLTLNPILVREARVRWRGNRAFVIAFIYTAILSVAMVWRYKEFLRESNYLNLDVLQRSAAMSHEIFLMLTWMQALAWMLLAPALTATSIVSERESGLLESIQLSYLSPRQIVMGKLWSVLSFIGLIILISMPITAVCFLLGGVSGSELGAALALHLMTAFTCASIGLAASAHYRRGNVAMSMAFLFLILWGIISAVAFAYSTGPTTGPLGFLPSWSRPILELIGWTNPIIAAVDIASPLRSTLRGVGVGTTSFTLGYPGWVISVFGQFLFALTRLWQTLRELRRLHNEPQWLELRKNRSSRNLHSANGSTSALTRPIRIWVELPWLSRISFQNPLLQREARSKFRLRRPSRLLLALFLLPLVTVAYLYFKALEFVVTDPGSRDAMVYILGITFLTSSVFIATLMGAGAFTRERESGTWEGLLLSLLPARSIVFAKVLAPLLACIAYSSILWPLLLPCITSLVVEGSHTYYRNGFSLTQVIAGGLVLLGIAWFCTSWGMMCSWFCKRTATATGWAIGSLFVLWIFVPVFLGWALSSSSSREASNAIGESMRFWHPLVALMPIIDRRFTFGYPSVIRSSVLWDGATSALAFFVLGCLCLRIVYKGLREESYHEHPF